MMQKARVCRLGTPCAPRTFKQLLACRTQHHPVLDAETIADRAELRRDRLYAFSNENDPSQIPFVALLKVCGAIENFDLLDFALASYGWHLSQREAAHALKPVAFEALDMAAATGALAQVVGAATADGVVGEEECVAIRASVRAARRELEDVESALERTDPRIAVITSPAPLKAGLASAARRQA